MTEESTLNELNAMIKNHESRILALENAILTHELEAASSSNVDNGSNTNSIQNKKEITLPEISRIEAAKATNGQQKVSIIVGYYEKIVKKQIISKSDIGGGWADGKFKGVFKTTFVNRAIKDGLIRDKKSDDFDLTQTGEDYFAEVIGNGAKYD